MNEYMKLKKSNCQNCYKCIRRCPVKSISFSGDQAQIVGEECVLCGQCFVVCPQNAKEIRCDIDKAKALIESGVQVYASVAPSFVANYEGITIGSVEKALKALGFSGAEETALGATMVKKRYDDMVDEARQNVIVSSCCHTVNLLIQKHFPEVVSCVAQVTSPMMAHCQSMKQQHPQAKTVFIGPCISKKAEAEQYPGAVDCVLTFEELSQWMDERGVTFEAVPDGNAQSRARLFPTAGGILNTMEKRNSDYSYISIDGMDNCLAALRDIVDGKLSHCFIEMSACAGSCIGGPGMDKNRRAPVREYIAVQRYAGREDFIVTMPAAKELEKKIGYIGLHRQMPGGSAIAEVLRRMGKTRPEHELNCGTCGYNTCREKAVAVLLGKADLSMCLPYLKERAESFSNNIISNTPNGIVVLNEKLEVQQVNDAACQIMNVKDSHDVLGEQVHRILDPQVFYEVLQNGANVYNKRVYLAEYRRYVEQTVIHDASYHILIGFMRDVTEEEISREKKEDISRRTIAITDKVIEKQMRTVQEIASLLGETTAETKIALTRLKESLFDE